MATTKTIDDLLVIVNTLHNVEREHHWALDAMTRRTDHYTCHAEVCIKCGHIRFSCESSFKHDCVCDSAQRITHYAATTATTKDSRHGQR